MTPEDKIEQYVHEINEQCGKILVNGECRFVASVGLKRNHYICSASEFQDLWTPVCTGVSKGVPIFENMGKVWLNHPKSKVYRGGVVFNPELPAGDNGDVFNVWGGLQLGVEPKENPSLIKHIEHHIENVVCKGDQNRIQQVYDWIAHNFQFPLGHSMRTAVLCRGQAGELLGMLLRNIWGEHGSVHYMSGFLRLKTPPQLEKTLFILGVDAFSQNKKDSKLLNSLIKGSIPLNRKGIGQIGWNRSLKVFLCTYEEYKIPHELQNGWILQFHPKKETESYYSDFQSSIADKDVQSAFLFKMLNYKSVGNIPHGMYAPI